MKVEINGHTFTKLKEIIKHSKRTDDEYIRFTVEPTDLFRKVWEDPRAQRGPLDKFSLERAYEDTYFLIAGSDWSNENVVFWHTKLVVQLTDADLRALQTPKEIAKELKAQGMRCNCDLDNWEPSPITGHSWVCRIHKATQAIVRN